jgi:hypothetical protein
MTEEQIKALIEEKTSELTKKLENVENEKQVIESKLNKEIEIKENLLKAKKIAESKVKEVKVEKTETESKSNAELEELKTQMAMLQNKTKVNDFYDTLKQNNINIDNVKKVFKNEEMLIKSGYLDLELDEIKNSFGTIEVPNTEIDAPKTDGEVKDDTPDYLAGIIGG